MKHLTTPEFWACYKRLPPSIRELADKKFELLKARPEHPSLHLKQVGDFWSARVGLAHRALGTSCEEGILWFWIGSHADYDKLLKT